MYFSEKLINFSRTLSFLSITSLISRQDFSLIVENALICRQIIINTVYMNNLDRRRQAAPVQK